MKVVITGARGFVGRELVAQCKKEGIEVISIDMVDSNDPNYFKADITKKDFFEIIPESVDAIIHLAALSSDKDCKNKATDCFNLNVMGTLNVIEVAEKKKAKQFIFASSEWVYNDFKEDEIKQENSIIDIAKHTSEYALSKLVSEINLRQKYNHGFCPTTILRFGIIYGPRKVSGSSVESLFNSVKSEDIIEVGSLKTGRGFIEVSDITSAIINSIGLNGFNIINLQGNEFISLGRIIETSKSILNKNPKIIETNRENPSIRKISNKYAKKILNWEPKIDLETGLNKLNKYQND